MNTLEEQKKLSESLLAACKAAGVEKPKYIFQGWLGGIYHSDEDPRTTSSPIFFTYEKSIGVNHPPYASDWQDSLLEWVDPQGEPLANVLARLSDHVADLNKMIDMQDAIADAYRNHVGRCGLITYAQTYRQGWQDALAWKAMAEKGGAGDIQ